MSEIMAIAEATWGRVLRMKVVYFLILCVLIIIGSAYNYDILSMGEHRALMIDVSLTLNTIAGVLAVISITFEISKELREGMASTLLTKPLGRTQYLIGKCIGSSISSMVITGLVGIGFAFVFNLSFNEHIARSMIQGHLLVVLSVIPMSAIAVLLAVIIPETFCALVTAIVIWLGYSTSALSSLKFIYGGILPDFNLFNLKAQAVYSTSINFNYIWLSLMWGVCFSAFAISLASLLFANKDLK